MNFRMQLSTFAVCCGVIASCRAAVAEPLFDWSAWEKYRGTVQHPSGAFKAVDIARARENLVRYSWARNYAAGLEKTAQAAVGRLTPEYLAHMIPATTPGDPKFTPCPACRDQGKPVHPHGLWSWSAAAPDQLVCDVCRTVFPNEKYPESIVLQTHWGTPQTLTFYGGEPFVIFSYKTGRPSFTANIRARKVAHMASLCRSLAETYLLSGDIRYAEGVRALLLRFASVYPQWLVHCGYGEYADMDPRTAAQFIEQLPEPELCPPPNQPDRRLHTGYWSAGRASGVGQESGFVRRMVESYDFTCDAKLADGKSLYSEPERRTIERDLLLEGTLLLVADKKINNKSVGNRTAAALVGLCVGHPGLVRFGWDGFQQTIDGWFLPDGTTSESPAYATMTLGNIWDIGQALRDYSDPEGYFSAGQRVENLNPYRGTAYERVWAAAYDGLQGNLSYPAFADSYRTSSLGANFVELMVANYPERAEYLALLKEKAGPDLSGGYAPLALYYREPGLETKSAPPLSMRDWVSPDLRIGHLRTGIDGRESLLLLSASHWGGHHHLDSLNLTYWKKGAELLSDLGYLWDHPRKVQTTRTVAHNTVLIDERDQATKERGGEVIFFNRSEHVKVMEASSNAYPGAKLYRRTAALIDHGAGRNYVVDFFRVHGGAKQDYVFHGAANVTDIEGLEAKSQPDAKLYDFTHIRSADGARVWRATWKSSPTMTTVAWNVGQPGERVFLAEGWGQRDWKNSDIGATLPYVIRRTEGDGSKLFISVFEGHEGEPFVRDVKLDEASGVLLVQTALGTDHVMSRLDAGTLSIRSSANTAALTGRFAVASLQNGKVIWSFVEPGGK
jgi:hypothetical protein